VTSAAKSRIQNNVVTAALKRCATQKQKKQNRFSAPRFKTSQNLLFQPP
jgi:hypothetical protein